MRNPFARPETTPQWLLGSVCWVVASLGTWYGGLGVMAELPPAGGLTDLLRLGWLLLGFPAVCYLVWRHGIQRGWAVIGREGGTLPGWYKLLCYVWFSLLVTLLLGCLLLASRVCWLAGWLAGWLLVLTIGLHINLPSKLLALLIP